MKKDELLKELRIMIPSALNLDEDDFASDNLSDADPFVTEDLGIDSIDVLEITVAIEKKFGVKIGDVETAREAFSNLSSLADFLLKSLKD